MTEVREEPPGTARRTVREVLKPLGWPALVVVLVAAAGWVPALIDPHFYFVGDTESGAYGQWYGIGTRLMQGNWWAVLNPTVWQAGVYLADGAWGFYSPLLWGLGLLSHSVENILAFSVVLKIAILETAALGTYVLARGFGVLRPWALVVAVAVPFGGFTSYQDISSWVTGAISWALFPWAWAGLRAFAHGRRSIFAALVPAGLLLGIVYTHATIMLITVVLAVAVEAIATRRARTMTRMAVAGLAVALMVVIAHLPALLVFPSSGRTSDISSDGSLVATPTSLLQAGIPFGQSDMLNTSTQPAGHPITYLIWLVPLIPLVSWRRVWRLLRRRASLVIFTVLILAFVQAPSDIGPLRWPGRLLPYAALAVGVLLVLGLSRARVPRPGLVRLAIAAAFFVTSVCITVVVSGTDNQAQAVWVGSAGIALLLAGLIGALSRYRGRRPRVRQRAAIILAAVATAALVVPQHLAEPTPGGPDQQLATTLSTYQHMLAGSKGDVFVVGNERSAPGLAMSQQAALGNAWYLTGKPVQNTYATLQYGAYTKLLCLSVKGSTCSRAFHVLFEREPGTGETWVDLFGISSILLIKSTFLSDAWKTDRPGWHVVSDTPETRLIVRDDPVPGAGGVVWSSSGTAVHVDSETATKVRFTVTRAGADPMVALSRLPWPGYSVSGGATLLKDPIAGLLLTVDLPKDAVGRTFTLTYEAPGMPLVIDAAWALGALTLAWLILTLLAVRLRRLRRYI